MLTFGKLRFKNFQSFGNEESEIDFNSQVLTLITGQNGAGKSTIVDALNFVCFGRPYRKIKIGDLVNRINGKHLWTELELKRNNQGWKIVRGLSPQLLEIWKGDVLLPKEDIKAMQDYIEKNILGFDEKIFRQIVTLGSGYYVPFLKLPLGQKREVIEQLFELDIISKMKVVVKDRLSKQQTKLYEIGNKKTILNNTISNLKEEQDRALKHNESIKIAVENEKQRIRDQILEKENSVIALENEISGYEQDIHKLGKTELIEKVNAIGIKISELTIELGNLKTTVKENHKKDIEEKLEVIKNKNNLITNESNEKLKLEFQLKTTETTTDKERQSDLQGIRYQQGLTRKEIDGITKDLEFYSLNTVCPTCKSELTGAKINNLVENLNRRRDNLCIELLKFENSEKDINNEYMKKFNAAATIIKEKMIDCQTLIETAQREIKQCEGLIETFQLFIEDEISKKSKKIEDDIRSKKNELADLKTVQIKITNLELSIQELKVDIKERKVWIISYKTKLENADKEAKYIEINTIADKLKNNRTNLIELGRNEKREKLIYDYFKVMEILTSDSGIKTQIIKQYLPLLAQKVNEYLALFQAEYSIELTEEFDVKIRLRHDEYVDYDNFSGGEKIRIDLALMFSFVSFLKMKTGAMCSLLFFDEILDSSLDMNGISVLVQILNLFTQNGFSIYVVSHREENKSEDFGKILEVKKEKFSEIKEM